ncbi:hypothetical protein TNCV_563351 [Trichonephila clavipes]|nr:hypothetical protein TNCV_563351 [Trichonephila clavipes]
MCTWDALGRQKKVAGRNYPPTNKNTLIRALTEEWDKLPQQLLDNVVQILLLFCMGHKERRQRKEASDQSKAKNLKKDISLSLRKSENLVYSEGT